MIPSTNSDMTLANRVYYGERDPAGNVTVTVDYRPLQPCGDPFTSDGWPYPFDWGCAGIPTQHLAYCLLLDVLDGDQAGAAMNYRRFADEVLSVYPPGSFHFTRAWLVGWMRRHLLAGEVDQVQPGEATS